MDITTLVASLLGPVYLAVGLGLLINKKYYQDTIASMAKGGALLYFGGAAALVVGLLITTHQNIWTLNAAGLVTLIGWIALLKGLALLILPKQMASLTKGCTADGAITIGAILAIVLGLYLTDTAYDLMALIG